MQKKFEVSFNGISDSCFYCFDDNNKEIKAGTLVVAESPRGQEIGTVVSIGETDEDLKKIIRIATPFDFKTEKANKQKAKEMLEKTNCFVKELKLDMQLVKCELMLDKRKVVISFTAKHRVDFRELVKKLVSEFRMKIELKQISLRDEFRIEKSVGPCGRVCCCVNNKKLCKKNNIKMAKIQGISLSGNNINGVCDKLKCCIAYEYDEYVEELSHLPKTNDIVETPNGKGKVVFLEILKNVVYVQFDDGTRKKYNAKELKGFQNDKS